MIAALAKAAHRRESIAVSPDVLDLKFAREFARSELQNPKAHWNQLVSSVA
jgi:hypothetical protein